MFISVGLTLMVQMFCLNRVHYYVIHTREVSTVLFNIN